MRLAIAVLLTLVTLSIACSAELEPDPTPSPKAEAHTAVAATAPSTTPPNTRIAPTPTPSATPSPTPEVTPTALLPDDVQIKLPTDSVNIQLPAWAQESPGLALALLDADAIIKAKLVSIVPEVNAHKHWGYVAELLYMFDVLQYLKGEGDNELLVRLYSGPKYIAFPDWLDDRSEEEAKALADIWLSRQKYADSAERDVILLLVCREADNYTFLRTEEGKGQGDDPLHGETWLAADDDSMYQPLFPGSESTALAVHTLISRIKELEDLGGVEYRQCINSALRYRSQVRGQYLGTYREFTIGGYVEPEPFPQFRPGDSHSEYVKAYRLQRPPIKSGLFGDYWLDGKDKDLFTMRISADSDRYYEGVYAIRPLPQGEYSVFFSQYHQSLPCHDLRSANAWKTRDTIELIFTVTNFEKEHIAHEAFFDPIAQGSSIGADATRGRIDPNSFHVDSSTEVTIKGIDWDSGVVTLSMKVDGPTVPAGTIEVVGQSSGWIMLNLPDAVRTMGDDHTILRWGVCDQPWNRGELLLLRLYKVPYWTFDTNEEECLASLEP